MAARARSSTPSSDDEEAMKDPMQLAESAEDEILKAKARGGKANLNNKQKLALKKKLKRELMYFVLFVTLFIYVLYARRTVISAYYMQQAISTAFVDEAFGDYNEKTFDDIATAGEMFDWMDDMKEGPFPDGTTGSRCRRQAGLRDGVQQGGGEGAPPPAARQARRVRPPREHQAVRLHRGRPVPPTPIHRLLLPAYPAEGAADKRMVSRDPFGPRAAGRRARPVRRGRPDYRSGIDPNVVPADVELTGFLDGRVFNKLEGTQVGGSVAATTARASCVTSTAVRYPVAWSYRSAQYSDHPSFLLAADQPAVEYSWVDRQTRAVIVSLNLYNGNFDYYCQSTFMSSSRRAAPSSRRRSSC